MTHAVWKQTSPLLNQGGQLDTDVQIWLNYVWTVSAAACYQYLTLDSDGITKTVQLTVFISKPPSQGVQEKDPHLLSSFQPTEILNAKSESECETCGGMKVSKGKQRNYKGVTAARGLSLRPEASCCSAELGHSYKSVYIWLVLRSWDILFFQAQKERRLGNKLKSKLTCLISLPPPLFLCSAALRERERGKAMC